MNMLKDEVYSFSFSNHLIFSPKFYFFYYFGGILASVK